MARFAAKIALATTAVVLALLAAELLLVFRGIQPSSNTYVGDMENLPRANFVPDTQLGWKMRPNHSFEWEIEGVRAVYRSDGAGFRIHTTPLTTGAERSVALVGDSFTWGFGMAFKDSFGARVARELGGWTPRNYAMPGFGIDQVWLSIRHHAVSGNPDLIIVGIYPDDFKRSLQAYRKIEGFAKPVFKLAGKQLVPKTAADRPGAVMSFLERHFRLVTATRAAMRRVGRQFGVGHWWSLNAALLDQMWFDADAAGIPLLFVHIPDIRWWRFPALAAYMARHGANYLDLTELSREPPAGFFFEENQHMSPEGHAWLALLVTSWVREELPELTKE